MKLIVSGQSTKKTQNGQTGKDFFFKNFCGQVEVKKTGIKDHDTIEFYSDSLSLHKKKNKKKRKSNSGQKNRLLAVFVTF